MTGCFPNSCATRQSVAPNNRTSSTLFQFAESCARVAEMKTERKEKKDTARSSVAVHGDRFGVRPIALIH